MDGSGYFTTNSRAAAVASIVHMVFTVRYLDADAELRDHAPGVGPHHGGAQNLSPRVLLDGDLGEPLRDALAFAAVDVRHLALYFVGCDSKTKRTKKCSLRLQTTRDFTQTRNACHYTV